MSLNPSEIGTQDYWESTYKTDLDNYRSTGNLDDTWFGQKSIARLLKWIKSNGAKHDLNTDSSILDIGTGNGALLFELEDCGYKNLVGVDYSSAAIQLCKILCSDKDSKAVFHEMDFLSDQNSLKSEKFNLCLDKGTYDAIALCPENPLEKRQLYRSNLLKLCDSEGLFVITSCNFTKDELLKDFSEEFQYLEQIPTATFQFGGVQGNKETVLVFKKTSS